MENNDVQKLEMKSVDITDENIEKIGNIFPNVIVESENGKKVDFDLLKQELSKDIVEENKERYQLTWAGKKQAILNSNNSTTNTLRPVKEKSVDFDNTQNIYIEGDNLEALKILQESYLNKIKCIYIDPPYNTGNDFIYNDNFENSSKEELNISGQIDEHDYKLISNPISNGKYHTNWLNLMYSRLKLSRNLLSADGAIFISIDDNEYDNLKKICDEIFGISNYMATFHIQVRYGEKSLNEEKIFKPMIEYILLYSKNKDKFIPNQPTEEYGVEKFIYTIDEKEKGETFYIGEQKVEVFKKGQWTVKKQKEGNLAYLKETWISGSVYTNMSYGQVFQKVVEPRVDEDGLGCLYKVYGRGEDGLGYRYYTGPAKEGATRGKMYSGVPLERVNEIKNGNGSIRKKPIQCFYDFSADFGNIKHEGNVTFNSGKKPVKMMKQILGYCTDENSIILDFFSGSASTAHAVIDLNSVDNGNRKFIMIQIPERISEKNDAKKEEFKTICDLGEERIRRSAKKIQEETNADIDYGFRVYKVDSSNMKDVYYEPSKLGQEQLNMFESNIKEDRTSEDLLTQVILDLGLTLDLNIEERNMLNNKVYFVAGNSLVACFDNKINIDILDEICKIKPLKIVFRESSFNNDSEKINAYERIKKLSPETEVNVL